MMKFVTDTQFFGGHCLIKGHENDPLIITDLSGDELMKLMPAQPWTHDQLMALPLKELMGEWLQGGADAYLGEQWIGSTEV